MSKLLIIRFSALGDVAMIIPVVWSLAQSYPTLEITILSRKGFGALFSNLPPNVRFVGADLNGSHKGMSGLHRLYNEILKPERYDYVADFHWVLRSIPFDIRFQWAGAKVRHICKGYVGKRLLTRRYHKVRVPLTPSFERYRQVLLKLGFDFPLEFHSLFGPDKGDLNKISSFVPAKGHEKWIGIAPFAKHLGKIYPLDEMQKVVDYFATLEGVKVFLFGAGTQECQILEGWRKRNTNSILFLSNCMQMDEELILMSHLDAMITMDSANMHLASLVNIPVVSVWGATHPYSGFLGYGQKMKNCVQIDLDCRPCSVFGNKPCFRKDYACMNQLPYERIIRETESVLDKKE